MKTSMFWKLLQIFGLLIVLFAFYVVHVLSGRPNPDIDYVQKWNEYSRPEGFTESLNAVPYYEQAYSSFVKVPDQLRPYLSNSLIVLPPEMVPEAENWLQANQDTLSVVNQASQLPYFYYEYQKSDEGFMADIAPNLMPIRDIMKLVETKGRIAAYKDDFDQVLDAINTLNSIARQLRREKTSLLEQLFGFTGNSRAINLASLAMQKCELSEPELMSLRDIVQEMIVNFQFCDGSIESLYTYDLFENCFVDKADGRGRFSWHCQEYLSKVAENSIFSYFSSDAQMKWDLFKLCFFGPTRKELEDKYEQKMQEYSELVRCTPYQLKQKGIHDNEIRVYPETNNSVLSIISAPTLTGRVDHYNKSQLETAKIAIAVKLFELKNGRLPIGQAELVSAGLLDKAVLDPFSDGELVYQIRGDDFILYSVGDDFLDNGGSEEDDIVFWSADMLKPVPEE